MRKLIAYLVLLWFFSQFMPFTITTIIIWEVTLKVFGLDKVTASVAAMPVTVPPSGKTHSTSQAS